MKAKTVNEKHNFERGQDPKSAMGIGMGDEFLVISLDATDNFVDNNNDQSYAGGNIMFVEGPMSYEKAKKIYDDTKGDVSNVYLVNVLESEISI
jgi:hypothetical protein